MTKERRIHDAIDAIRNGCDSTVENMVVKRLDGGTNSQAYLVADGGYRYVVRMREYQEVAIGTNPHTELQVHTQAAKQGIAPKILYADSHTGVLVTEHVSGAVWTKTRLQTKEGVSAVARLLRKLHAIPLCGAGFEGVTYALAYQRSLIGLAPEFRHAAAQCVDFVRKHQNGERASCCHNDMVAANIVGGAKPVIIDWEYAADNHPYFDIASLIGYHDLDSSVADALLLAYDGEASESALLALRDQLQRFNALQWLWLASKNVRSLADTGLYNTSDPIVSRLRSLFRRIQQQGMRGALTGRGLSETP